MEQFEFYESQDFWVSSDLAEFLAGQKLGDAGRFYEGEGDLSEFGAHFATPQEQRKLKREWPDIWKEFDPGGTQQSGALSRSRFARRRTRYNRVMKRLAYICAPPVARAAAAASAA